MHQCDRHRRVRVWCLHGSHQTVEIFRHQLSKLTLSLEAVAVFHFVEAPHLLPLCAGDSVRTRSWCCYTAGDEVEAVNGDAEADYSLGDQMLDAHLHPPPEPPLVDILLGFSQGGLVACRYFMRHAPHDCVVKGVILIGTPDPRRVFAGTGLLREYLARRKCDGAEEASLFGDTPSLHIAGKKDDVVPPEESAAFAAACGPSAGFFLHEHAHSVPQQQAALAAIHAFLVRVCPDLDIVDSPAQERGDELEMIAAMYGEKCVQGGTLPSGAVVTLPLLDDAELPAGTASSSGLRRLSLRFRVPWRYPTVPPEIDIVNGPARHHVAFVRWRTDALARCTRYVLEDVRLGNEMLLAARMFLNEQALEAMPLLKDVFEQQHLPGNATVPLAAVVNCPSEWDLEDDSARARYIREAEEEAVALLDPGGVGSAARRSGGTWTPVIGLIGKPSAGKSTFFNAITDPYGESEAARVAAFPFTTIAPNVGTGYGALRCPCSVLLPGPLREEGGRGAAVEPGPRLSAGACDACYGHVRITVDGCHRHRRHPIQVKDVAGLVQGAYCGKGKGNQFLNDLCDADVLVHVVDGASATDAGGVACAAGQGSALQDILWVRHEVHSWIYDNLRAKWAGIWRQPAKLRDMFTGYGSPPVFVDALLQRMGIDSESILQTRLKTWGPRELHLLVALFVRERFPMVVALNKADVPAAGRVAKELRHAHPHESFHAMSARVESDLLELRRRGLVEYAPGGPGFVDRAAVGHGVNPGEEDARRLRDAHAYFDAIAAAGGPAAGISTGVQDVVAVALRRCASVLVYPVTALCPAVPSLAHCFAFRPGATAEEVFWALAHAGLLDGQLVRFEALHPWSAGWAPVALKKTDVLPTQPILVRVLSNKRNM